MNVPKIFLLALFSIITMQMAHHLRANDAPSETHFSGPSLQNHYGVDPYLYGELERLSTELQILKKNMPAKPNPKKGWGTTHIGGRIYFDSINVAGQHGRSQDEYGDIANGAGLRELRLSAYGDGFDAFDYKLEVTLSPQEGKVGLFDNWIGVKNLPLLGYVRVGHHKPETGFAYTTPMPDAPLMEYVPAASAFSYGRRVGISSTNLFCRDRVRFFLGVFQEGDTMLDRYIQRDNQGQVVIMRLSALPHYVDKGRELLHVGGHWSYASTEKGTTVMSEAFGGFKFLGPSITTGQFDCDHYYRGGLELVYQNGPFAFQTEAFFTRYSPYRNAPGRTANGAYAELKYFLTGEHRTYDPEKAVFLSSVVHRNFHPFQRGGHRMIDGWGAWQAVLQWSYVDMGDWRTFNEKAGHQHDLTVGMNWFWTPNIRWVF